MSIFKECDIRGVYGQELDEDTALRLGRVAGARLLGREVVVGGDLRPSTPGLKAALVEGLLQSGAVVIDLGFLPTPAFYYAKRQLGAHGGIMVTASHNPARYNGFKLMFGDLAITPDDLQGMAREMEAGQGVSPPGPSGHEQTWPSAASGNRGTLRGEETIAEYCAFLEARFSDLHPHHVVVDAGNGSMWDVAPKVLRAAGQRVEELYCVPDGTFPHRDPNPAIPRHLADLTQRVRSVGAEMGVAYDGDGDRVIFVDHRGEVQPADRVLVLFVRHLLPQSPGARVVYDIKSSMVVAESVRAGGGEPLMERSGHAFIKRRLLTEGAILGGEISGHYFFGPVAGDDSLYATLLLLRVLDGLQMSLAEAMGSVPSYPITPDLRLPCERATAEVIFSELAEAFRRQPISRLDGVRIEFPQGWALARFSVTEPLITLRFEARDGAALEAIQNQVRQGSPQLARLLGAREI